MYEEIMQVQDPFFNQFMYIPRTKYLDSHLLKIDLVIRHSRISHTSMQPVEEKVETQVVEKKKEKAELMIDLNGNVVDQFDVQEVEEKEYPPISIGCKNCDCKKFRRNTLHPETCLNKHCRHSMGLFFRF